MQFRRTTETDIDQIMDILTGARKALRALGIDQWQGGYPHREAIEDDVLRGNSYVVFDEGGRIVATGMVGFDGERDYDHIEQGAWLTQSLSDDPCYAVIHRVAVDASCKGRGAASFLLDCAERMTRDHGCTSVRIDTHPGNVPMRNLLVKGGFTECGTIYIAHAGSAMPNRVAYERFV